MDHHVTSNAIEIWSSNLSGGPRYITVSLSSEGRGARDRVTQDHDTEDHSLYDQII